MDAATLGATVTSLQSKLDAARRDAADARASESAMHRALREAVERARAAEQRVAGLESRARLER